MDRPASSVGRVRATSGRVRSAPGRAARRVAGKLAGIGRLPTSLRAVLAHFEATGEFDVGALDLRATVESEVERMVEEAFAPVEAAIAEEFDVPPGEVEFDYETKLLMPAELTLARLYRRAIRKAPDGFDPVDREVHPGPLGKLPGLNRLFGGDDPVLAEFSSLIREVEEYEEATRMIVIALLDGDMRDAINDGEYGDFETPVATTTEERRRVAEIAQSTLQERVESAFEEYPDAVRDAYERAVDRSEAHQDRDPEFREMMAAAEAGDPGARDRIRAEYRDAGFADPPDSFEPSDLELPYFRTQYDRVGVIYRGMFEAYRGAGIEIDDAFERSVVLAIIGAQVWLDDVDDYAADMREGQLTPVTAEYLLADSETEAHERVIEVTEQYLDRAREYAAESDSTLTGIAVEYILRSGDPGKLPR